MRCTTGAPIWCSITLTKAGSHGCRRRAPAKYADARSKPPKMTATTRGFRSLYLLHQSLHQMHKNAKPISPGRTHLHHAPPWLPLYHLAPFIRRSNEEQPDLAIHHAHEPPAALSRSDAHKEPITVRPIQQLHSTLPATHRRPRSPNAHLQQQICHPFGQHPARRRQAPSSPSIVIDGQPQACSRQPPSRRHCPRSDALQPIWPVTPTISSTTPNTSIISNQSFRSTPSWPLRQRPPLHPLAISFRSTPSWPLRLPISALPTPGSHCFKSQNPSTR
ncbi:hypothetical protein ACLOJK_004463 [Asimina triloba]